MQMGKNFILGLIYTHWTQIQTANFFFKNLAAVTKYQGQVSAYQKKLMIQSWENLVADEQTDRVIS